MTLNLEGQLWNVVEFQHVKPGKGPAFVRTKLKNVLSGVVRLVDDIARQHVLQLGAYEGRALTGLDVLEVDDLPQLAVDHQHQSVLEIGSAWHGWVYLLEDGQSSTDCLRLVSQFRVRR